MNGYILISRKLIESEIWKKPPLYLKVWIWLLSRAQFKDYNNLKRGQLFTSVNEIREACSHYSGYRKETPSPKQIRTILAWLRNPSGELTGATAVDTAGVTADGGMVVTTEATRGIVVTICNYNDYQDSKNYGGNDDGNDVSNYAVPTGEPAESSREDLKGQSNNEEGKNKEKKEKKEKKDNIRDVLAKVPEELRPSIESFMEHRKQLKSPLTGRGLELILSKVNKLSGGDIDKSIEIINQSIERGWKGVFELKEPVQSTPISNNMFLDMLREEAGYE